MEDDTNPDSELETFEVEYTASELYALHGLLRYLSIDMDHRQSMVAESLAKTVHDTMSTDSFSDAMEDEMDEFEQEMEQYHSPSDGADLGPFDKNGFA